MTKKEEQEFDFEWLQLIWEAKNLGITKEEIQTFLQEQKSNNAIY